MTARLLIAVVRAYQRWLSPLLGPRCRFAPSCSSYAAQALEQHGVGRGSWLALRRLARCHPFHPGGHDPVPPPRPARPASQPAPPPVPGPAPDPAPRVGGPPARPVSPPRASSATMERRADDTTASRPGPGG